MLKVCRCGSHRYDPDAGTWLVLTRHGEKRPIVGAPSCAIDTTVAKPRHVITSARPALRLVHRG